MPTGPGPEVYCTRNTGRANCASRIHPFGRAGITIGGQPFHHMLYQFVLTSFELGNRHDLDSESFAALSDTVQNALWTLGGVPLCIGRTA